MSKGWHQVSSSVVCVLIQSVTKAVSSCVLRLTDVFVGHEGHSDTAGWTVRVQSSLISEVVTHQSVALYQWEDKGF